MTVRVAVPTADRSVAATAGPVAAASGAMGSLSRSAAVTVAVVAVAVSVGRFGRRKWGLLRRGHRPIIARTRGAHCSPRPL
ncbi:hypothetical protein [Streptomyces sp. NPDC047070]|uniref:hypothetical protein n=1 Tax=Streptomyces sp. NPDC047070 TaxID=3154923 RepID=UPI003451FABD